jgi:hypothetical protein
MKPNSSSTQDLEFQPILLKETPGLKYHLYVAILLSKDLEYTLIQNTTWKSFLLSEQSKNATEEKIILFSHNEQKYLGICLGSQSVEYQKIVQCQKTLKEKILPFTSKTEKSHLKFKLITQTIMG